MRPATRMTHDPEKTMRTRARAWRGVVLAPVLLLICLMACVRTGSPPEATVDAAPAIEFVRTPDERFHGLPDYPFEPHYAMVEGLRVHYVDEGPADASVIVLLHGEPSWSYLYRHMIPPLVEAGYRVIAPDLIGFGRSDKPVDREDYSYAAHVEWMRALLFDRLRLEDVTLFAQDWGGLIGLRLVAEHPDRFARVAVANTTLPLPEREPPPLPPERCDDVGCASGSFLRWLQFSQTVPELPVGQIVQAATVHELPPAVIRAYDAPFPDERYKAGARAFPALVPIRPEDPAVPANRAAWQALEQWEKPFLTLFSDRDPITAGLDEVFRSRIPGARGQPHQTIEKAGHFLQEDRPAEIVAALLEFLGTSSAPPR
jgi:haloalkane dehalogenase